MSSRYLPLAKMPQQMGLSRTSCLTRSVAPEGVSGRVKGVGPSLPLNSAIPLEEDDI
jgi:hypothetical protein